VSVGSRVRPDRRRDVAARSAPRAGRQSLVKLVTRLITAQAAVAAAIGLAYSRKQVPSIIITLMLVVALLGLAAMSRSGTPVAWMVTIGFETAFVMFGLIRFITSRYVGGTLFGMIALGVLLHPAVARAFSGAAAQAEGPVEAGADALRGPAAG
jgi:ribose/xylose/arabinose/galactoside ABC-type transport system permease subunit